MSSRKLIGVDIGTQGTKAALFSGDGESIATAFVRSNLHRPEAGVVEENADEQYAAVCATIRECVENSGTDPADVAGIAIDGQMAGVIGIDASGRAITPYDSWLDTRCSDYIELMQKRAGVQIVEKAGCAPSFNHGPKILWWMNERPEIYSKIAAFVQPGGYASMRLCGLAAGHAFIDASYLHFCGFADNANSRWNSEMCSLFGVDEAKLPRIVRPHQVVGETSHEAARECGLNAETPVVAGCGDTAASFLSCGGTEVGVCVDVAGTASVFATTTDSFKPDIAHRVLACGQSATPGLWHPYAYVNGGGMNLEWFRAELAGAADFEELNTLAASAEPDDDAPIFVPHFAGRACPSEPGLRGAWANLNWNHKVGHLYRAILEGVALEYGVYRRVLGELYPALRLTEVRVTGGGEKSALWNSIKADVMRTDVIRVSRSEGAPMGSAMLAGFGVGLLSDLPSAAREWVATAERTSPRPEMADYYSRRLERYSTLLERLNGV